MIIRANKQVEKRESLTTNETERGDTYKHTKYIARCHLSFSEEESSRGWLTTAEFLKLCTF